MTPNDLEALSQRLEQQTGYDSIPTIERMYRTTPSGTIKCCYPHCTVLRRRPEDMWRHIHFSQKHGLSFGVADPEDIDSNWTDQQ